MATKKFILVFWAGVEELADEVADTVEAIGTMKKIRDTLRTRADEDLLPDENCIEIYEITKAYKVKYADRKFSIKTRRGGREK